MSDIIELFERNLPTPVQHIIEPQFEEQGVQLFLKRDDLIHHEVSGNKWRKLKYNLLEAQRNKIDTILTFGGAFSNHIAATAAACRMAGLKAIGIIRGEELSVGDNPTLRKAAQDGMHLEFISRESYRRKTEADFLNMLRQKLGDFFMVPEGASNDLGMKGCAELMDEVKEPFDFICVACGTGTTIAGIISAALRGQTIIGFPALKGGAFLEKQIQQLVRRDNDSPTELFHLMPQYHFGGYASHSPELLQFIKSFRRKHDIELDFIYTAKMIAGIYDLIEKRLFAKGAKILAVHSGGLQGNSSVRTFIDE